MTVVDFDERTITFVKDGTEVELTWGELNFLKHYKAKEKSAAKHSKKTHHRN